LTKNSPNSKYDLEFPFPLTITFTDQPKQVDVSKLLLELKKNQIDINDISKSKIQNFFEATPQIMKWLALSQENLKMFITNPQKVLEETLQETELNIPMRDIPLENIKCRLSHFIPNEDVQKLFQEFLIWIYLSDKNILSCIHDPEEAMVSISQAYSAATIETAKEILHQLNLSKYSAAKPFMEKFISFHSRDENLEKV